MVILARAIMGGAGLLLSIIMHTYIGEMGTKMDAMRGKNGKVPRKHAVYVAYLFGLSASYVLNIGKCCILVSDMALQSMVV